MVEWPLFVLLKSFVVFVILSFENVISDASRLRGHLR